MNRILFGALALASLSFSVAGTSRATSLDDLVQVEILDGGMTARGTVLGAIRLTLADGWKTYWRAPGEAGIPPSFNWRGSRNVGELTITWPAPHVFEQSGLRSIGYKDQVVLPIEITPRKAGQPVRLKGEMEFGVCKDICVPASRGIDHTLDAEAPRNPAIAAALAQRPYSASEAGVRSATCRLVPTGNGMQIEAEIALPDTGGSELAVFEPSDPSLWATEAETRRQGNTLYARSEILNATGGAFALDRSQMRITVLGSKHAVDIIGCQPG
ncbi:protein-disulfide reductase DsbD domain-containing protein [Ruegeria aquimaris]|uniref:Protein-disulfide reductase DsbD family protein n=1 Tax=Ruegeria aquimaris TaxID=2984333 RepID=A0ABT3AL76_9RHOB|nr:protein-disulfide reductase DsbD domain-containing protein [Ruegeria sp. XHP0148]MCV2889399.1 protein-disulfide reductase DsbD family protein [Ruegeria sp. XHP0148]